MLKKFFESLFQKWEVIYSTHDVGKYAEVKSKLLRNNIKSKTESFSSGGGQGGGGFGFATTYHILVQPHDVRKAHEVIYHSK